MPFPRLRPGAAILALALGLPALAETPPVYRTVTATELLAAFMEGGFADWVEDPMERGRLSTLMGTTYLFGVADATRDQRWCPGKDVDINALLPPLLDHLAVLPPERRGDNAATVVAEALASAHPCPR